MLGLHEGIWDNPNVPDLPKTITLLSDENATFTRSMGFCLPSRFSMVINDMRIERMFIDHDAYHTENVPREDEGWFNETPPKIVKSDVLTMMTYLQECERVRLENVNKK